MSDRVLFATSNFSGDQRKNPNTQTIDVDYPTSSGFSGFPFRPRLSSKFILTPQDYRKKPTPAVLSFAQAVEMYWRVRKWRVTFKGTAPQTNPSPPPTTIQGNFSYTAEFEIGTTYTFIPEETDPDTGAVITPEVDLEEHVIFRERDLCQFYANIFGEKKSDDRQFIIQFKWPTNILSFVMWDDRADGIYKPQSKFFPGFATGSPVYGLPYPFSNRNPLTHPYGLGNPHSYTPIGKVTIELENGIIIEAPNSVYENSNLTSNFTCDIEIKATQWWPYANKSGEQVYDEDTGAQINDPLG